MSVHLLLYLAYVAITVVCSSHGERSSRSLVRRDDRLHSHRTTLDRCHSLLMVAAVKRCLKGGSPTLPEPSIAQGTVAICPLITP